MRIHITRFSASKDASILKAHGTQANRKQAREKGERKRQKAKENGEGERQMKTANVKWGRGKREATGNKSNAREEFVRPTWIDLDFSSPTTAPEMLLMSVMLLHKRPSSGARNGHVDDTRNPSPLVFPRSGEDDVAQRR